MRDLSEYDEPQPERKKRQLRKRILIVTEGAVTEKAYFEEVKRRIELRKDQLIVHEVEIDSATDYAGNSPSRVVESAKKLKDEAAERQRTQDDAGSFVAKESYDEVWVVFDTERDGERIDLKPAAEHAESVNIDVAISKPSFESWFLLHLRDGLPGMTSSQDACSEISKITKARHGRPYSKTSKKNADLHWLIETIIPDTQAAVRRSEVVAKTAFSSHNLVPDQCGTSVHKLVCVLWESSKSGAKPMKIRKRHDRK